MIAEEEDRFDAGRRIGAQPLDHLRRMRPAVDQVAEEHEQDFSSRTLRPVALDLCQQLFEQIEPAVDVADDIGAVALARHSVPNLPLQHGHLV